MHCLLLQYYKPEFHFLSYAPCAFVCQTIFHGLEKIPAFTSFQAFFFSYTWKAEDSYRTVDDVFEINGKFMFKQERKRRTEKFFTIYIWRDVICGRLWCQFCSYLSSLHRDTKTAVFMEEIWYLILRAGNTKRTRN